MTELQMVLTGIKRRARSWARRVEWSFLTRMTRPRKLTGLEMTALSLLHSMTGAGLYGAEFIPMMSPRFWFVRERIDGALHRLVEEGYMVERLDKASDPRCPSYRYFITPKGTRAVLKPESKSNG